MPMPCRHLTPRPADVVGSLWLVAAALFVAAAVLLVAGRAAWRITAVAGVVVSVPVIGLMPGQAVAGLVVDGLVLAGRCQLAARPGGAVMTALPGPLAAAQPEAWEQEVL